MLTYTANAEVGAHRVLLLGGLTPGFSFTTGTGFQEQLPCIGGTVCTVSLHPRVIPPRTMSDSVHARKFIHDGYSQCMLEHL